MVLLSGFLITCWDSWMY